MTEQSEQRLRIASKLLDAHNFRVAVSAWDGTRCDLLVAHVQDAYGLRVLEIAQRRSIRTLALTHGAQPAEGYTGVLVEHSPVLDWVPALIKILEKPSAPAGAAPRQAEADTHALGLCQLATDPSLQGKDLQAHVAKRTIILRPSTGRVSVQTDTDLLFVRDQLAEPGWEFRVDSTLEKHDKMSLSLDSFYMHGALAARDRLPPFPAGRHALKDWPDLGAAPSLVDVLRITKLLLTSPVEAQEIARATQLDVQEVSACLWAFAASGLLESEKTGSEAGTVASRQHAPAQSTLSAGLLGKLAVRFGLIKRPG